jgi:hypothetical protein
VDLARAIRDRIQTVLSIETESGPLTKLMKAFQQALIHDLSADDFADMYAQTIVTCPLANDHLWRNLAALAPVFFSAP